jgi:hypothetical protein
MEDIIEAHPEWHGKVQGILMNAGGSISGVSSCAGQTTLPILQDVPGGDTWTALGAASYTTHIFDQNGVLYHSIAPAFFSTNADAAAELEAAVNELLVD